MKYLRGTGRSEEHCRMLRGVLSGAAACGVFRSKGQIDYSTDLELDLAEVKSSVAGPKRPQDRIELPALGKTFGELMAKPAAEGGYGKEGALASPPVHIRVTGVRWFQQQDKSYGHRRADVSPSESEMRDQHPTPDPAEKLPSSAFPHVEADINHGQVLIAAITSCTNTSNPSVMLAAGLLAKKAVEQGLRVNPLVKTSLAPGSRVVTDYLTKTRTSTLPRSARLQPGGYGCTTCIGNSGPLAPAIEDAIVQHDLVCASVLSGNRNFEARVHPNIKANFLMSPPLVVAFALAGRVDIDLSHDPLGKDKDGRDVFLRDVWPTMQEVRDQTAGGPQAGGVPGALLAFRGTEPEVERNSGDHRGGLQLGPGEHLYSGTAVLRRVQPALSNPCGRFTGRGPWASLAIPSPPTTFHRRAASSRTRRRGNTFWKTAWLMRISTVTGRAVGTIGS